MDQNQLVKTANTPLINRLFFALVSLLIIADPVSMIFLYKNGADTPSFIFWMIFSALAIFGFVLTTLKAEIKFRLHQFWTPIGLGAIIFTAILLFITYDGSSWNNLTESVYLVFGAGLMVAFTDLKVLQKYANFFIPFGFFATLELFPAGFKTVMATIGKEFEWGMWVDLLLFLTGPIFLYAAWTKLKNDHPGWKKITLAIGGFIIGSLIVAVIGIGISKLLPKNSWSSRWFANQKPMQSVICTGSLCGQDIYIDPYSNLSLDITQEGIFRDRGNYNFPLLAQDHALLGCGFKINTDEKNLMITCKKKISGVGDKILVLPFSSGKDKVKNNNEEADIPRISPSTCPDKETEGQGDGVLFVNGAKVYTEKEDWEWIEKNCPEYINQNN